MTMNCFLFEPLSRTVGRNLLVEFYQIKDIFAATKEYRATFVDAGWDDIEDAPSSGCSNTSSLKSVVSTIQVRLGITTHLLSQIGHRERLV